MDLVIWLAIYSTLLAISTFIAGFVWQLRTVNYHQYVDYSMSCYTHFTKKQDHKKPDHKEIAARHCKLSDDYKASAENAINSFFCAFASVVLLAIGWCSIVVCLVIRSMSWGKDCTSIILTLLILVAIVALIAAVIVIWWPHRKNIGKVVELPEEIEQTKDQCRKTYPDIFKNSR